MRNRVQSLSLALTDCHSAKLRLISWKQAMLQDATCNSSSVSIDLICVRHHRFFTEMAMYALDVLAVVTLVPATRRPILGARMRRSRMGISILLGAAAGHTFMGNPEVHALCRFQSLRSIAEPHPHARNPSRTKGKLSAKQCAISC